MTLIGTCLVTTAAFADTAAPAPSTPSVVLVSLKACCAKDAWPEAETATQAELTSLGLDVIWAKGAATTERERRIELHQLAERHLALAAVRILKPTNQATSTFEIWVDDRVTGKTLFRELPLTGKATQNEATLAALRVSEALRASLIEVRLFKKEEQSPRLPAPALALVAMPSDSERATPAATESPSRYRVGAAVSRWQSTGRVGPNLVTELSLVRNEGPWSLSATMAATIYGDGIDALGWHATFDAAALRLWAGRAWFLGDTVFVDAMAGGGALVPWSRGVGPTPIEPTTDNGLVSVMGARTHAGLKLQNGMAFSVGGELNTLVPRIAIRFGDTQVARYGRWLWGVDLGLAVPLP